MKRIIHFHIYKGDIYYVAEGVELPVVTQGKTLDELMTNLREAVDLQLEGERLSDFDLAPEPALLADIELPVYA
jgi:predicted RNase H-like HicB family nuclease